MSDQTKIDSVITFLDRLEEASSEIGNLKEILNEVKASSGETPETIALRERVVQLEEGYNTVGEIINQMLDIYNRQSLTLGKYLSKYEQLVPEDIHEITEDRETHLGRVMRAPYNQFEELRESLFPPRDF